MSTWCYIYTDEIQFKPEFFKVEEFVAWVKDVQTSPSDEWNRLYPIFDDKEFNKNQKPWAEFRYSMQFEMVSVQDFKGNKEDIIEHPWLQGKRWLDYVIIKNNRLSIDSSGNLNIKLEKQCDLKLLWVLPVILSEFIRKPFEFTINYNTEHHYDEEGELTAIIKLSNFIKRCITCDNPLTMKSNISTKDSRECIYCELGKLIPCVNGNKVTLIDPSIHTQ